MTQLYKKRIWLYCHDDEETKWVTKHCGFDEGYVVGVSCQNEKSNNFPHSGLTPAMQAAIRGEIDILMVANLEQLGQNPVQVEELIQTFASYNVSVRSFRNRGNSNS